MPAMVTRSGRRMVMKMRRPPRREPVLGEGTVGALAEGHVCRRPPARIADLAGHGEVEAMQGVAEVAVLDDAVDLLDESVGVRELAVLPDDEVDDDLPACRHVA